MAAIVADALCLGSHYEYDAHKISKAYGYKPIERFMSPGEMMGGQTHGIGWGERNYHPGKKAGGTTDYGDYNIVILEHLAATAQPPRALSVAALIPHWMHRLENGWGSWICTMTRETYAQVKQGVPIEQLGGISNAMAIRHVAAHAYYETEEDVVSAARKSMFTHRDPHALGGAEFFARVTHRVINGATPEDAIEAVARLMGGFFQTKVSQAIAKWKEATHPDEPLYSEPFADDLALTSMARLWDVGRSEPSKVGKAVRQRARSQGLSTSFSNMPTRKMVSKTQLWLMPWSAETMLLAASQLEWSWERITGSMPSQKSGRQRSINGIIAITF